MSSVILQKLGLPTYPRTMEILEEDYPQVSLANRMRLINMQFAQRQNQQPKDITKPPENLTDVQFQFDSTFQNLMNNLKRLVVSDVSPIDVNTISLITQSYAQLANIYNAYVAPKLQQNEIFRREIYTKLDQLASVAGTIVNKINAGRLIVVDSLTKSLMSNLDDFGNFTRELTERIAGIFEAIRQNALTRSLKQIDYDYESPLPGQVRSVDVPPPPPPSLPFGRPMPDEPPQPELLEEINPDDLVEAYNEMYNAYREIAIDELPKEDIIRDAFSARYGRQALDVVDRRLNELEQGRLPRKFVGEPYQERRMEKKEPRTFASIDTGLQPRAPTMSKYYEPRSMVPRTQFKATQRDTQRLSEGTDTTRYIPSGFIPTTDQEMRLVRRFPRGEEQPPPFRPPRYQDARRETSEMTDRMLKSLRDVDVLSKRNEFLQERLGGPVFQPSLSRRDILREKRERSTQIIPVSREKAVQDLIERAKDKVRGEWVQDFITRPRGEFGETPSFTEADIAADTPRWRQLRKGSVYNLVDEEGNFIGQRRKA